MMQLRILTALVTLFSLALSAPDPEPPFFLISGFGAFITAPSNPQMHSWTAFNVTLIHPNLDQRFTTLCAVHTSDALCNPLAYTPCEAIEGAGHEDEKMSFRFSKDLKGIEIKWMWKYGPMNFKTTAYEGTYWNEGIQNKKNVTVTQYGKYYERVEGWVFQLRTAVG